MARHGVYPQQLQHVRQVHGHVLRGVAAVRLGAGDRHFLLVTSLHSDDPHNLMQRNAFIIFMNFLLTLSPMGGGLGGPPLSVFAIAQKR